MVFKLFFFTRRFATDGKVFFVGIATNMQFLNTHFSTNLKADEQNSLPGSALTCPLVNKLCHLPVNRHRKMVSLLPNVLIFPIIFNFKCTSALATLQKIPFKWCAIYGQWHTSNICFSICLWEAKKCLLTPAEVPRAHLSIVPSFISNDLPCRRVAHLLYSVNIIPQLLIDF